MKDQRNELRSTLTSLSRPIDDQHIQLKLELDKWQSNMIERVQDMYQNVLIELDTSYERLDTFRQTLDVWLNDERLTNRTVSISASDIIHLSTRLSWLETEIETIGNVSFHVNCHQVKLIERPSFICSTNTSHNNSSCSSNSSTTTTTTSTIPCRVLIKREHADQLPDSINGTLYTLLTYSLSPEAILITNNVNDLAPVLEQLLTNTNELRVLVHECYAPFIIGQLGSRARMLKDKYALNNVKVYPTCAPLSTERVLLLSGPRPDQLLQCLTEIYLNMSQTHLIDATQQPTFLYSPEFYDVSLADDYGGFVDRQLQLAMQRSMAAAAAAASVNDEDEMSGYEDEDVEDFDNDNNNYQTQAVEPLRERHWTLSDAQAGALFGPNSSRLHQIRSESNAWIVIYEAEGKSTRRPMSIRGTKAEIEHATKLILETIKRHDRKLPLRHNHKRGK